MHIEETKSERRGYKTILRTAQLQMNGYSRRGFEINSLGRFLRRKEKGKWWLIDFDFLWLHLLTLCNVNFIIIVFKIIPYLPKNILHVHLKKVKYAA
jgi:hypothetical protein